MYALESPQPGPDPVPGKIIFHKIDSLVPKRLGTTELKERVKRSKVYIQKGATVGKFRSIRVLNNYEKQPRKWWGGVGARGGKCKENQTHNFSPDRKS